MLNFRLALGTYRGDNGELVLFVLLCVGMDEDGVDVFDLAGVDSWLIGDSWADAVVGVVGSFSGGDDVADESFGR